MSDYIRKRDRDKANASPYKVRTWKCVKLCRQTKNSTFPIQMQEKSNWKGVSITNPKQTITIDPEFEALIPPLTQDEFNQLRENILEVNEVYDPLITWQGLLIDGHNRWRIIQENPEVTYKTIEVIFYDRNEAKLWIINNQLGRRNLEKSDAIDLAEKRAEVTAQMAKEKQLSTLKQNKDRSIQMDKTDKTPINTQKEIAKTAGVSAGTVARYQEVKKKAPELVPKIKSGEMTIGGAYKAVKEEEKAAEPPKPIEPPKPPQFTITDLCKEVEANGENFVRLLRDTLIRRSTLYSEPEDKEKVREEVGKIKSQIEAIENLLK